METEEVPRKNMPMNPNKLPVTVVIPAFNADQYIGEALESIRAQTVLPAEIIVVDDGSTDRTVAIASGFGVKLLHQERLGPSAARNAGIIVATQPWVAFLDSDDIWEPGKLEAQWAAVRADRDIGAVFTDFIEFDRNGPSPTSFLSRLSHYKEVGRSEISSGIFLLENESLQIQFNKGNFMRTSTLLIRRDLLSQVGLFNKEIVLCEDREICLRLFPIAKVAVVERPLVRYRLTDLSHSSDELKVSIGAVMVADRVTSDPQKYSSWTVDYYKKQQPIYYLTAGRLSEASGKIQQAREYYLGSWRLGGGFRPLGLAILSCAPAQVRSLVKGMVRLFRKLASN
jgi:glycosyltransferase involved in cell wall biosynthesis